jgi:hypothetical protein
MRAVILAVLLLILAVTSGKADECVPLKPLPDAIDTVMLSHEVTVKAGLFYSMMPPTGAAPVADVSQASRFANGSMVVLFLRNGMVCDSMIVPASPLAKQLWQGLVGQDT